MPGVPYQQLTLSEADTAKADLQQDYVDAGIDGTLVAVSTQINNFGVAGIPLARQAEFDASDNDKQNQFLLISAIATSVKYAGQDYVAAWEAEYEEIFG